MFQFRNRINRKDDYKIDKNSVTLTFFYVIDITIHLDKNEYLRYPSVLSIKPFVTTYFPSDQLLLTLSSRYNIATL